MKHFVIITHGKFASGILNTFNMIVGKQDNMEAVDCYVDSDFSIEKIIGEIIYKNKSKELIFITDILGGSVNNYILSNLNQNIYLISGLNLPLLIELIDNQNLNVKDMINISIKNCFLGIRECELGIKENIEDEDF